MVIIGIDEVGLGPIAGPVVVSAVAFMRGFDMPGLTDSKAISDSRRRHFVPLIKEEALWWVIARSNNEKVDKYGVHAVKRACMRACIRSCVPNFKSYHIIIDGIDVPTHSIDVEMMKKADTKIPAVSAASVLAKVYRDDIMNRYAALYPRYGFDKHSGYPTKRHIEALQRYGPCKIHRRSYAPVKRVLESYTTR
jgi:ribonuclease HII